MFYLGPATAGNCHLRRNNLYSNFTEIDRRYKGQTQPGIGNNEQAKLFNEKHKKDCIVKVKNMLDNPSENKNHFHILVPSPTSGVMILKSLKEHLEQKSSELNLHNAGPNKTTIRNSLNEECGSIRIEDSREERALELELVISSFSTLVDLGEAVNELTCAESNISYLCPECSIKKSKNNKIKLERYFLLNNSV